MGTAYRNTAGTGTRPGVLVNGLANRVPNRVPSNQGSVMSNYQAAIETMAKWIVRKEITMSQNQLSLFQKGEDLPLFNNYPYTQDDIYIVVNCSKCGRKFEMSESAWQAYAPDDPTGANLLCPKCGEQP